MKKLIPTLLAFSFLVSGCGEFRQKFGRSSEGTTQLRFAPLKESALGTLATLNGTVMVYVTGTGGTNYTTNVRLDHELQDRSLTLPNGNYKVFAVGWDGYPSGYPVEGQAYCGFGNSGNTVVLAGTPVTIPITMTTANCSFTQASVFANSGQTASTNFAQLSVEFCNGISATPSCTTSDSSYGGKYLKFMFDIYVRDAGGYHKIATDEFGCGFINTSTTPSSKRIPPGGSAAGDPRLFAVRFSVHTDAGCSSAPLIEFAKPNGLANTSSEGLSASGLAVVSDNATFYVDPI